MIDANGVLSENQDLSQVAGAYASTNVVDLGSGGFKGDGEPLMVEINVGEDFASAGAATLTIAVQDGASDSVFRDILTTRAFALAELIRDENGLIKLFLPGGPAGVRRYVRLNYTIGTATTTAGTVTAVIRPYKG